MNITERNNMGIITNTIATIASKPITGVGVTIMAWCLKIFGVITPFVTFVILLLGLGAAIYAFVANRNKAIHYMLLIEADEEKQKRHSIKPKK